MNTELHTDSFPIACCLQTLLTRAGFAAEFSRNQEASISDHPYVVTSSVSWDGMKQAVNDAKQQFPITAAKSKFAMKNFATYQALTAV